MTAPPASDVKVLFLAGKGRSGSTLLAMLLGQLPGFFDVGELNRLWDAGLVLNYRCGCGEPFGQCSTWSAVLAEADALLGDRVGAPLERARIDRARATVVRWPRAIRLLRSHPDTRSSWFALDRYTDAASAVYRAIASVTGARVIVDSSKIPFEPVALGLVPDVDVRIAHVIRDPRAVVYSWKRSRALTDRDTGEHLPRFGAVYSTTSWTVRNALVELLRRRGPIKVVHYHEMARDPAAVLRRLADFVGEPAGDLEFLTSQTATLVPTHSVGGNPVRMTSGEITIEPDDGWREQLAPRDRLVGTALALPLLHRYGLPIRSRELGRR